MAADTTLFRARVPKARLARAEKILSRLGLKPGEAFNLMLAQVELRQDLPFAITTHPQRVLTSEEQATAWKDSLGAY
jgi:addiction module RelB/DinJ family antitoxin